MITPSYSATATERVLPRMALDFTTGVLDPRVAVVRTTTGTFVGSNGLIQTAAINGPRFNYNPVTLAPRGLLIEEQRTNLLIRSEEFETANWGKVNLSTTANTTTAPSGAVTADSIIENTAASSFHQTSQAFTATALSTYTFSVFLKANGRDTATLMMGGGVNFVFFAFNLTTATVGAVQYAGVAWSNGTASITNYNNGWYRCVITGTASVSTGYNAVVEINEGANRQYTGNGTSGLFVWGAQLEVGLIPTSYIPTVASQVIRNNDQVSMTGTNFSSWYNASEGTFLAVADAANTNSANTTVYEANDGVNNIIYGVAGTVRSLRVLVAGSTVAELNAGAFVNNVPSTVVGAYKVNDYLCAKDGGTVQADTVGAVPTGINQLSFGSNPTFQTARYLNGHVAKFYYYPQRLTSAEVRAYSKFT